MVVRSSYSAVLKSTEEDFVIRFYTDSTYSGKVELHVDSSKGKHEQIDEQDYQKTEAHIHTNSKPALKPS